MIKLQGIYLPLVTPFQFDGALYPAKIRHNVEKANAVKLSGYVAGAASAENALLAEEELIALWEGVAAYAAEGRQLLAGIAAPGVRPALQRIAKAASLGYTAAVAAVPQGFGVAPAAAAARTSYFRAIADQSTIPVIIDNPAAPADVLTAGEIVALSAHPNIVGVIAAAVDPEAQSRIQAQARAGFAYLCGSAADLFRALKAGASGAVPQFANAAPYACITIWEAFRMRDDDAGWDWQNRIAEPARLVTLAHGIPGLKYAMDVNGYYGGAPRLPLAPVSPLVRLEIEAAFAGIKA